MNLLQKFLLNFLYLLFIPIILFYVIIIPKKRKLFIWGTTPIINNKYWSEAIKKAGYPSLTLMNGFYSINKREDFDLYFDDLIPLHIPRKIRTFLGSIFALLYIIRNAKVIHLPFHGGPIGHTIFYKFEGFIIKLSGIKTVLIPYGSDAYMYSKIIDPCLRNCLLINYPDASRNEFLIEKRVKYWIKNADVILTGIMIDGIGRWDITIPSVLTIDENAWKKKKFYSMNDGYNGPVKILHTPNHRGVKGTEFLIQAVNELINEGLQIELLLLEKVPNDYIKETMQNVDILAEQFIITGYGLSAIEGMASGLPVLSNLDNELYTRIFRRYSYLNECPILSTTPETLKENLRILITNPKLRRELGEAGRQYIEKYHSYEAAQYLFGSIYKVILEGEKIDLINLFHPLNSDYVKSKPCVKHPLVENRLAKDYYKGEE